jgi:hypothetical protein
MSGYMHFMLFFTMGPSVSIGSSCLKINGPIQGHRQHLLKQSWAQSKLSAAAGIQLLGPFEIIGSSYQKIVGPNRNHRLQLPET